MYQMITEKVNKDIIRTFDSGAIRSKESETLNYSLITPIGLKVVASYAINIEWQDASISQCINAALDFKFAFLSSSEYTHYLAHSCMCLLGAMELENKNLNNEPKIKIYNMADTSLRFDLIPYEGLTRVAKRYHLGKISYGMYNWERGMDVLSLQDHSIEHIRKYQYGINMEDDNLAAAAWGDLASIHSLSKNPEINKLLRKNGCSLTPEILEYHDNFKKEKLNEKAS